LLCLAKPPRWRMEALRWPKSFNGWHAWQFKEAIITCSVNKIADSPRIWAGHEKLRKNLTLHYCV
jgi:hypothetical protein